VTGQSRIIRERGQTITFAMWARRLLLPEARFCSAAGGHSSPGPDQANTFRQRANYVDKILKGAQPADLPVEQSTELNFVINLTSARALGLTVPRSVLDQATEVIQ
jgi:putative ABC transport system substrate-binding protein